MKKLLTMFVIVAACHSIANGQNDTVLKQIRKSETRLQDVIAELTATPGYARLLDGNGRSIYLTSKPKQNLIKIWFYDQWDMLIDVVKVNEEDGDIRVMKIVYSDIREEDFYSYLTNVPQRVCSKFIWR